MLPLKVLIVDDHRLFRQGLISIMSTQPQLVEVVGEAAGGEEAIHLTASLQPDVILLDIYMPEMDGLQVARRIHAAYPQVAIIMLTSSEVDNHLLEAIRLGASGYLLKNLDAHELFDLLSGVARGESALTRAMANRLAHSIANQPTRPNPGTVELTEREIEILKLLARGASNSQIASELFIAVNTVKFHLKNILSKLGLENRTQVAAYALQNGIAPLDEAENRST